MDSTEPSPETSKRSAGKGDTPRPVDKAKYHRNYARIDWKKKPKENRT